MDFTQLFQNPGNSRVNIRENAVYEGTTLPRNYQVPAADLTKLAAFKTVVSEQYGKPVNEFNYQKGKAIIGVEGERLLINKNELIIRTESFTVALATAWSELQAEVIEKAVLVPYVPDKEVAFGKGK